MKLSIEEALQQGITAHRAGKLQDAERLYRAILQSHPAHPDANHNLGVLAVSLNKAEAALTLFKTALEANPMIEQFWLSYIDALIKEQQFDNAKQALEEAKKQGISGEKLNALEAQLTHINREESIDSLSPSQELLSNLFEHYQNGRFNDAEKLALSITEQFSKHQFAWKVLGAIFGRTGRKVEAADANQKAVALSPRDAAAHSNLGVALKELGRLDEAEASYIQAIRLKPDYVEAHNNLGNTLKELGRLDEAAASYNLAIALKPDYTEAHCSLGNTLKELGRLDEAEASYSRAIRLKPDYAEAHCSLGVTLHELGRLDEAEASFVCAVELNPRQFGKKLSQLLTVHVPQKYLSHPIIRADQEIREIDLTEEHLQIIPNQKIAHLFEESLSVLKKHDLNIQTDLSQIYRNNSMDLNCKRHKTIFHKFNIIPKFCFSCYKVQIEPRTILELIKLMVIFDRIKLDENNIRKCMIELRPEISGFYKGLVYCSSVEEAKDIVDYLSTVLDNNIGPGLPAIIKRGCSEYPDVYPDFKKINNSETEMMSYNPNWELIEKNYEFKTQAEPNKFILPTLSGLSLNDVLIIQNWIDYAKGIGDKSVEELSHRVILNNAIFNAARSRLNRYSRLKTD